MLSLGITGTCGCALCQKRADWYDKAFAFVYTHSMDGYEEKLTLTKAELFAKLMGAKETTAILEVGVGPGQ